MRALVCGSFEALGDVLAAIESAADTAPGTVGRVDNAFDALEVLDGKEPMILFLEVSGSADPGLAQFRALVTRGARVIVLAHEVAADVRVAAIKAGAREVLFAPWTPERVQARLVSSTVGTSSVAIGAAADFRAILLPDGTNEQVDARITNLSSTGFMAERLSSGMRRDQIVRAAIQVPPPDRLPVLFARAVDEASTGTAVFRFVGLSQDEEQAVDVLVARLLEGARAPASAKSPPPVAVSPFEDGAEDDRTLRAPTTVGKPPAQEARAIRQTLTRVIEELDAEVLREGPSKWLGHSLPVLTDAERVALVDGTGDLAKAAVWRTRAHVVATILEASPDLSGRDLPWTDWREKLSEARDAIRRVAGRRVAEADLDALREVRDVQSRLNAVSDRIDRLAKKAGVDVVRESDVREPPSPKPRPDGLVVFQRGTVPLPPRVLEEPKRDALAAAADDAAADAEPAPASAPRVSRSRLAALAMVFVALAGVAVFVRSSDRGRRRHLPERTAVAHRAIAEVGGIRVRSTFLEQGTYIVVVDGSWYEKGLHQDPGGAAEAARLLAAKFRPRARLEVRDIAGWRLAELEAADTVTRDASAGDPTR